MFFSLELFPHSNPEFEYHEFAIRFIKERMNETLYAVPDNCM